MMATHSGCLLPMGLFIKSGKSFPAKIDPYNYGRPILAEAAKQVLDVPQSSAKFERVYSLEGRNDQEQTETQQGGAPVCQH